MIFDCTEAACRGEGCTPAQARALLDQPLEALKQGATQIREAFFDHEIDLCVIVNARSGACRENCRFCAQSAHYATETERYPLQDPDALLDDAKRIADSGARTYGIVTSGPTVQAAELESICAAIRRIPDETPFLPCASLGALKPEQFRALKDAGLTRFHHNLETSEAFYPTICTTHTWAGRVETVRAAQAAGLEVCCGGLFGLGETWEDRIDLACTLRALNIQSVPVNYLNPVPGTPLEGRGCLSAEEGLRILAVYRHLLPRATIRVCGGRPAVLGDRQEEMFAAGANALMTGDYLTTSGISPATDRAMITRLGLHISTAACGQRTLEPPTPPSTR